MTTKINFNYTLPVSPEGNQKIDYPIFGNLEKNIQYIFSGKSAISLALRHFRHSGQLSNKSDQLLVPSWMGTWIYMTMHKFCFPTTTINNKVKGVFVYHQWGFPQKMDEILKFCNDHNLFCIEDCAHAFDSYYKNRRLGTLGDVSIFSLSKFFPSVVGGALFSNNEEVLKFVNDSFITDNPALSESVFNQRDQYDSNPNVEKNIIDLERNYAIYDKLFKCPDYSLNKVKQQLKEGALNKRANNVNLLKEEFRKYDYLENLFNEKVNPWIFPLFLSKDVNRKVAAELTKNNIESGVYNFDVNRNLLEPDFKECVGIPCHQGVSEENTFNIIEIIRKTI